MQDRSISNVIRAQATSDGAGVSLHRSLGTQALPMLDPFLMLDEFRSDDPNDYIAGFPDHPHRGFETVTYMLAGAVEHKDSVGNTGRLVGGGAQWMTAGRGIIHSEMPQQENGLLWGFQLWVNLPAKLKMTAPRYQDIEPGRIPEVEHEGAFVRVVAGTLGRARGPVEGVAVEPSMFDVRLHAGRRASFEVPATHNAFVYVFEGAVTIDGRTLETRELAVLGKGDRVTVASTDGARFLLLAGRPLKEPVARYGPFVMSNPAEIKQAFLDFHEGRFAR
jgi:redox-sensitive bicupin YhaK (pirin superfamily)